MVPLQNCVKYRSVPKERTNRKLQKTLHISKDQQSSLFIMVVLHVEKAYTYKQTKKDKQAYI